MILVSSTHTSKVHIPGSRTETQITETMLVSVHCSVEPPRPLPGHSASVASSPVQLAPARRIGMRLRSALVSSIYNSGRTVKTWTDAHNHFLHGTLAWHHDSWNTSKLTAARSHSASHQVCTEMHSDCRMCPILALRCRPSSLRSITHQSASVAG